MTFPCPSPKCQNVPNTSRAEQPHAELWEKSQSMAIATKGSRTQSAPTRAMSHRTLNNHGFGVPLGPDTQPPEPEDVADNVEPQTVVGNSDMAQPIKKLQWR
jgi:hypothetical protein